MRDSGSHPSADELMEALDGAPDVGVRAHLAGCDACRTRLEEAGQGLQLAAEVEIPDPPPLYWEAFGRQVARRLESEPATRRRSYVVPAVVAAAFCLMIAGVVLLSRWPAPAFHHATLPEWSALPEGEDVGLMVLQAMDPTDEELRAAAGCLGAAECLAGLSDEESGALADALRDELGRRRADGDRALMRPTLLALCLACVSGASSAEDATPRAPARAPRDEVFKMLDAYVVSNLQESLDLTDEQFVRILPLVKRVQTSRREYAQQRARVIAEMSRLFESGGATEARIVVLMTELKAMEVQSPAKLRRDVDALDSMLTPVQQAKLRILEVQVERRIRNLMARIRSESPAGRRQGSAPLNGATQPDDTPSP